MSRKKSRSIDSDSTLTLVFLGLLVLSALAGFIGQFAHIAQ